MWLPHVVMGADSVMPLVGLVGEDHSFPSSEAEKRIEGGRGDLQRRSPIRWSSQMLLEKKSIPGLRVGWEFVRAFRCERRNMLDLPTTQGAMATMVMAV